ncbi:MAG: alpha/beta hydrolase family protein [Acidimicrobiia bacterium]
MRGRIHLIDWLAPVGFRLDRRSKVFVDGWGDSEHLSLFERQITAADAIPSLEVEWSRKEEHTGFRVRRAVLPSPVAEILPESARAMSVEWIEPASGSERIVVLMPAWKDETFDLRRDFARRLVERGVGSLIADIPLYGRRRIHPDSGPAIRTVADFAVMGFGAVAEARGLVGLAGSLATPGVSGFSMGGNLAAHVSATMPRPVATAPLAASYGPGPVYLDAALRRAIVWDRLGGRATAEPRLRSLLDRASILTLPPMAHSPASVLVAASRDGFVPLQLSRQLAAHWEAELRVVHGAGHGTLLWRHRRVLIDAIADSFDRLGMPARTEGSNR